ncbi:uncharacterized protein BT62DRAFT_556400 [Guyanagaster necrorhizus]|uniref:Uncharacterized protein n=1 Tax=Guyanagaster necrorhizus TaxID=856835 RepID=A0A9P7VIN2_9AGAR|nr:uncharacterized protein BT62DRAFT_556400 [Guyanagaster necrorhizus MCA 3950]KAG7441060.1 hypothetical protein BT62DRAFT_556400 [Guyanagaster necrorhizus MCA 3950]
MSGTLLVVVVRQWRRVRVVWHCRCHPRWANRYRIVIYGIGMFIATGAMVLGLIVPLAAHEIQPVVGLGEWVMVYGTPEHLSFLRRLLVVIALLAEERQKEPPVPLTSIKCWRIVWGLAGNVGVVIQNREHRRGAWVVHGSVSNITPLSLRGVANALSLQATTFSRPKVPICNVAISDNSSVYAIVLTRV